MAQSTRKIMSFILLASINIMSASASSYKISFKRNKSAWTKEKHENPYVQEMYIKKDEAVNDMATNVSLICGSTEKEEVDYSETVESLAEKIDNFTVLNFDETGLTGSYTYYERKFYMHYRVIIDSGYMWVLIITTGSRDTLTSAMEDIELKQLQE